jgi:hypothetical protein
VVDDDVHPATVGELMNCLLQVRSRHDANPGRGIRWRRAGTDDGCEAARAGWMAAGAAGGTAS